MFYIIELQHRPDGIINSNMEGRQSKNSALSHFHDRFSKMALTTLYTSVSLLLIDADGNVLDHKIVETMWVDPNAETAEVPEPIEN